ncbi:3-deoxy-manno-octulosonate cytidylyltransferase [Candidatus Poribacteria bacterium]|nr:3-deoxy-manno-octulosonate cytidylyltransferase [Candidatus Poribacteria bacterium]
MRVVGVIPARYASSRFEGKALADILGKPMVQHVYERSLRAQTIDLVIVATDDERIYEAVKGFGGEVVMTSPDCPTGTHRVAEVIGEMDCEIVLNIQGDEPLLESEMLDAIVQPLLDDPTIPVCTLVYRIRSEDFYRDPNVVKVVVDRSGFAMYFSRSPIPGNKSLSWDPDAPAFGHIGLYAYRKEALLWFVQAEPAPFERAEGLEQLRFLENGYRIRVIETDRPTIGVDTPADLERVIRRLSEGKT